MRHSLKGLLWKIAGAVVPFVILLIMPLFGIITFNVLLIALSIIWANTVGYLEGRHATKEEK